MSIYLYLSALTAFHLTSSLQLFNLLKQKRVEDILITAVVRLGQLIDFSPKDVS
jgi:hypothetical protein